MAHAVNDSLQKYQADWGTKWGGLEEEMKRKQKYKKARREGDIVVVRENDNR